jgi:hypothetical protein
MAVSDVPDSFGFPTLIRIFFPGLIITIIAGYTFSEHIQVFVNMQLLGKLASVTITGMLVGLVLTSLDLYIYQFFEGIRFWPESIWWYMYRRELKNYKTLDSNLESKERELESKSNEISTRTTDIEKQKIEEEIVKLNMDIKNISRKIREYPYDPEEKFRSKRHPVECTNLGNILAEYESYPKEQYGMDFGIFWYHMWLILPKEIRDEIDISAAKSDFLVYLSFIFLIAPLFIIIKIFFIKDDIYEVVRNFFNFDHFFTNVLSFLVLMVIVSLLIAYSFYRISILAHKSYGRYIKSLFDIYRIELSKKTGIAVPLCPNIDERNIWAEYGKFLEDYKELRLREFRKKIK